MDQPTTEEERKRELITRLAASRNRVAEGRARLKERLNPLQRMRQAISRRPVQSFAIAGGAAFAITLLRRRSGKKRRSFSLKGLVLRGAFKMAQPTIRFWLLKLAKERFLDRPTGKISSFHDDTP